MSNPQLISLIKACVANDQQGVEKALADGADPDQELDWDHAVQDHCNAFSAVLESGNREIARFLLSMGANPNVGGSLSSLTEQLGEEMIPEFIEAGLYVNEDGDQALFSAIEEGNADLTGLLLNHGANPNAVSTWREANALEFAREQGDQSIIALLEAKGAKTIEREAPLVRKDKDSAKSFVEAIVDGDDQAAISALDKQFDFNVEVEHEYSDEWINATPLAFVSEKGNEALASELIKRGADVNASDSQALLNASENGHLELAGKLINSGAYVNAGGDAALFSAIENDSTELVSLLLEKGANPNAFSSWKGTPLSNAAKHGKNEILQLLLEKGANPVAFRSSALYEALETGYAELADSLLSAGAELSANQTRLDHVLAVGFSGPVIKLLAEHGHVLEPPPDDHWKEALASLVAMAESGPEEEE